MDAVFFWLFSAGMIVCALAVILNRNAVASALCFTFSIVFMAGLFVMLSAFFLAAVQILVTAGAVMVLFLFLIMLLDLSVMEHMPRQKIWMGCSLLLGLGFLAIVAKTLTSTPPDLNTALTRTEAAETSLAEHKIKVDEERGTTTPQSEWDKLDDTHKIGKLLFSDYVAPFEITSLIILVATIGVIVLSKQDDPPRANGRNAITREAPARGPKPETALKH
jgi:NADH-quinone oxidoreductase subunit J